MTAKDGDPEESHSLDVSLIIAPAIHEYIVGLAEEAGIDYDEGLVDEKKKASEKKKIEVAKQRLKIDKLLGSKTKEAEAVEEEPVQEVSEAAEPEARGFMQRRVGSYMLFFYKELSCA